MRRLSLPRFFKKKPLVGLDIGIDEIRLLELRKTATTFQVERLIHQKLSGERTDNKNAFQWDEIKEQLRQMVIQEKLSGYPVALALSNDIVHRKQIQLPAYLKPEELPDEITVRLLEYFPDYSLKELCFDFIVEATRNEMHHILLFAAQKAQFQAYTKAVAQAGLVVRVIDVDVHARARAGSWYLNRQQKDGEKVSIIVDSHWPLCTLMVFQRNVFVFYYQWQPLRQGSGLLHDIKQAWSFALAAHAGLELGFIGVSGNFNDVESLSSALAEEFSVPIACITPLKEMSLSLAVPLDIIPQVSQRFLLCCGLAMRGS